MKKTFPCSEISALSFSGPFSHRVDLCTQMFRQWLSALCMNSCSLHKERNSWARVTCCLLFCLSLFPCMMFCRAAWWVGRSSKRKMMWECGGQGCHWTCVASFPPGPWLSPSVTLRNLWADLEARCKSASLQWWKRWSSKLICVSKADHDKGNHNWTLSLPAIY